MKEINVKRMEVSVVEGKLNNMLGTDKKGEAFLTILTLTKNSPKYNMHANAPFVAIVKKAPAGGLAVFNCLTAKHEIIPENSYKEPTPITGNFEFKGHIYEKNPVHYMYTLKK